MNFDTIITSAAVGAITSALFSFLTQWFNQRAEERRQLRSLAFQAAIENWKTSLDIAKLSGPVTVEPLDVFLVHAIQLTATMTGKPMTPQKIREHVRRTLAATRAAQKEIEDYNKESRKGST